MQIVEVLMQNSFPGVLLDAVLTAWIVTIYYHKPSLLSVVSNNQLYRPQSSVHDFTSRMEYNKLRGISTTLRVQHFQHVLDIIV